MSEELQRIFCIGDSHVSFFSGEDVIAPIWPDQGKERLGGFKVFRLGPVLAYNLSKYGTLSKGREKLFLLLDSDISNKFRVPPKSKVLLCFGEIDCRAHLLKQAAAQKRDILSVVSECTERYFGVIKDVAALGYEVVVWNAIPSTPFEMTAIEFPTYGTCQERNALTRLFNNTLADECSARGIPFVSIFEELVDERDFTRSEYYFDKFHLGQSAMPSALQRMRTLGLINGDPEGVLSAAERFVLSSKLRKTASQFLSRWKTS